MFPDLLDKLVNRVLVFSRDVKLAYRFAKIGLCGVLKIYVRGQEYKSLDFWSILSRYKIVRHGYYPVT